MEGMSNAFSVQQIAVGVDVYLPGWIMWCSEWITGRMRLFLQQPAQPEANHGQGHHKWKQEEPLQPLQPHAFIYVFTVPRLHHKYGGKYANWCQ